jgi:hypothetical protein
MGAKYKISTTSKVGTANNLTRCTLLSWLKGFAQSSLRMRKSCCKGVWVKGEEGSEGEGEEVDEEEG